MTNPDEQALIWVVLLLLAAAAAIAFAGCASPMGELRGWDAKAREKSNWEVLAAVDELKTALPDPPPVEVSDPIKIIERRAEDEIQRAKVAQADHNHLPEEAVVLGSPQDVDMANAYAGAAHAIGARRKSWREFRDTVLGPIQRLWSTIDWALSWLPYAIIALGAGWVSLYVYKWWGQRKRDEALIKFVAESDVPKETKAKAFAGSPLGKRYDRMHKRGDV